LSQKSTLGLFLALIVTALTFVVYAQTLGFDFVNWDDDVYLYENSRAQTFSLENVFWFFSHSYYHSYIPITMLSHMVDLALWQFNPSGHHLTNVIIHALNTCWLFVLSLKLILILIARDGSSAKWFRESVLMEMDLSVLFSSSFAALLFGLHPLRVESVAWISDRKDLLCALFLLPGTICYINYVAAQRAENRWRWYIGSFLLFLCGCLSKSVAVTAPVVFLLMDIFLLRRIRPGRKFRSAVTDKIPFLLVGGVVSAIAVKVTPDVASSDMFDVLTPVQRGFLPFHNSVFYLAKMILPRDLSPIYPLADERVMIVSFVVFAVVTLSCLWLWKKEMKFPLLAWSSYVLMLLPSAGFSTSILQTTADRYSYLPLVSFFILGGGTVGHVLRRISLNRQSQFAIAATALLVTVFLGFLNFRQQSVWKNSETLWGKAITLFPTMPLPHNNFALALQSRGAIDEAEESFNRAIRLKPNYVEAHLNLGNIMFAKRNLNEAERLFRRAAELNPRQAEVYNNLGVVSSAKGNPVEAIHFFRRSVEVNPEYAQGYFNLGALHAKMGNNEASVEALKQAAVLGHRSAQESLSRQGQSW
jgi:Tfp pilus assembly protein PilF